MQQVQLDSVSRVYGRLFAVHRVSTEFPAGTITALVGDNGSGKTTLLSLLATLERPSDGSITYDDVSWSTFSKHYRERVGWIAHESLLYEQLTGRENLEFYANMYGVDERESTVDNWLERVGLADDADRQVDAYSRGMRQRLTIARALLHDPDLLLLDEPLTGLDRRGRETIVEVLGEMRDRQKIVILASHDLDSIDTLADRLLILRRGKVTHAGERSDSRSVAELYRECA
jgi:heme ABC exporter ATP-binding subunit CcmA